jgi:hypothetical protein
VRGWEPIRRLPIWQDKIAANALGDLDDVNRGLPVSIQFRCIALHTHPRASKNAMHFVKMKRKLTLSHRGRVWDDG